MEDITWDVRDIDADADDVNGLDHDQPEEW
jgi:hypothetical protein